MGIEFRPKKSAISDTISNTDILLAFAEIYEKSLQNEQDNLLVMETLAEQYEQNLGGTTI